MAYTSQEREAIRAWAVGSPGCGLLVRDYAIAAHHAMLDRVRKENTPLPYDDPHFEFMREVDNPCPDLGLRAKYRRKIIHDHD